MGLGDAIAPSQLLNIRSGDGGVTDTLKIMAQVARQYKSNVLLRQTAANIVQRCPPKDDYCEVEALQGWVRGNIRYTGDVYETETIQTPDYTLTHKFGDCDDQAVLLATLLLSIGIPAAYCALGVQGGPYSHVMAVANVRGDGGWLPLETTLDQDPYTGAPIGPGWFPPDATCTRFFHI